MSKVLCLQMYQKEIQMFANVSERKSALRTNKEPLQSSHYFPQQYGPKLEATVQISVTTQICFAQ